MGFNFRNKNILCISALALQLEERSRFQCVALTGLQESNNASVAEIIPGLNKLLLAFITTAAQDESHRAQRQSYQ